MRRETRAAAVVALMLVVTACEQAPAPPASRIDRASEYGPPGRERDDDDASPSASPDLGRGMARGTRSRDHAFGNTAEGARFAGWALSTDPDRKFIRDAFVRDDRVLDLVVSPTLTRRQIQHAMEPLLSAMERTFPGQPVEVIAYDESGDQLARMTVDSRTGRQYSAWRE